VAAPRPGRGDPAAAVCAAQRRPGHWLRAKKKRPGAAGLAQARSGAAGLSCERPRAAGPSCERPRAAGPAVAAPGLPGAGRRHARPCRAV